MPGEDGQSAIFRNCQDREPTVRLTFIGKDPDSNPTGASWVMQGWAVTDPEALTQRDIPDGEGCVEIPDRVVQFFRQGDRGIDNG